MDLRRIHLLINEGEISNPARVRQLVSPGYSVSCPR